MKSIWTEAIERPKFPALEGEVKTDVLIIGAGLSGLWCGYKLSRAGIDCIIAESGRICQGVTQNTTAKITCHHGAVFDKMTSRFGKEAVALYLKANNDAVLEYKEMCENIACDFKEVDSFVYSLNDRKKIENEVKAINKAGVKAYFEESLPLPFEISGAVRVPNQAQFHPLEFCFALAEGLKIFENTRVTELIPEGALTEKGKIKAEKIIVATHFPFINKHGSYFLKLYQHRSYVLALKNAQRVEGIYVDEDEKGLSFRNFEDYPSGELLLLGGGSHRTGKKGGNWEELSRFAGKYYPKAEAVGKWATQDCKTLDDIPYIGQYSKSTQNLYVTTGFNKWGVTSSLVGANILTDLITGRKNEFAQVFSPSRSILRPQLAINSAEAVISILTPTAPRCPHLGCALKYNPQEHSWDCPCHGSRFGENGRLLNNPATKAFKD